MKRQVKQILATIPLAIATASGQKVDAIVEKEGPKVVEVQKRKDI